MDSIYPARWMPHRRRVHGRAGTPAQRCRPVVSDRARFAPGTVFDDPKNHYAFIDLSSGSRSRPRTAHCRLVAPGDAASDQTLDVVVSGDAGRRWHLVAGALDLTAARTIKAKFVGIFRMTLTRVTTYDIKPYPAETLVVAGHFANR
jgi:hypothetical protein